MKGLPLRSSRRAACIGPGILFGVLSVCGNSAVAQQDGSSGHDGFVVDHRGRWASVYRHDDDMTGCRDGERINTGQLVFPGQLFQSCDKDTDDFIEIARRNGEVHRLTCRGAACETPVPLPILRDEPDGLVARIVAAAARVFHEQPTRYVTTAARGARLREAVLEIADESIDFAPAFVDVPAGAYLVTLRSLDESLNETPSRPVVFESTGDRAAEPVRIKGQAKGLFQLRVVSDFGRMDSWVLLEDGESFERARAEFQRTSSLISQWENTSDVIEGKKRALLRAALDELSSE